jgi:ring-1,2-phenylacetyl-CoA epoxidase subunit PaaE
MSSTSLHLLAVLDVHRQIRDAVTITLQVPDCSREDFRYLPGQYLTVRHQAAHGEEMFRSYSICHAPPADGSAPESVRIAVKLDGPGGFSEFAHARLRPGDTLDVLRPAGLFRLQPQRRHLAVAAGSGITPVLAMAEAALLRGYEFGLVFGNRTPASTMFAAELAELERRFIGRFRVVHVLSRADRDDSQHRGRVGADNLPRLLAAARCSVADGQTQYYLCGPVGMVRTVRSFLADAGVERRRIHAELFVPPALESLRAS